MTTTVSAYAATSATEPLSKTTIERRDVGPHDVAFDIKFAGICHSDIHTVKAEWGQPNYPVVPGHEIAGVVTEVGSEVTAFKVGDHVGVGCMVGSCQNCENCAAGKEQYCTGGGMIGTYNATDKDGSPTQGGYSQAIVAIIGLGGLGHMGVKLAAALGAEVTVLSQSLKKMEDGLRLGASEYYATSDRDTFKKLAGKFDVILNTVSANLDLGLYINLLKIDGTLVELGAPEQPLEVPFFPLAGGRRSLSGSMIGGIPETQEMLDFCDEHDVTPEIEVIEASYINEAYERVLASDVRYRFVIDTATI
jgi:alcohol dehydrogenase (NADP+)